MLKCYQCDCVALFAEKGVSRLFCQPAHHVMYQKGWSTLLDHINKDPALKQRVWTQLGMKRGLPSSSPIVMNHIENLPDDMMGEILLYVFDGVGLNDSITAKAIAARDISVRLQKMIDLYILGPVKKLELGGRSGVSDQNLSLLFPGLEYLRLYDQAAITDAGLRSLTRLRVMDLSWFRTITDRGLSTLSSLETLILFGNEMITDRGVSQLPQLKKLDLSYNRVVKGYCLKDLIQLESLILRGNDFVTGTHLVDVSHTLKYLNLDDNEVPDLGNVVRMMTNLEELSLADNETIMDNHLVGMTQLKALFIPSRCRITMKGISTLAPQLTYLDLWNHEDDLLNRDGITDEWLDLFRGRDTVIVFSYYQELLYNTKNLRLIVFTKEEYDNYSTMRRLLNGEGIVLRYYEEQ